MKLIHMVAGAALAVAVTAGCSGTDEAGSDSASASSGAPGPSLSGAPTNAAETKALSQCLRDKGLEVPDVDPDTGMPDQSAMQGMDQAKLQEAVQDCREKISKGNGATSEPTTLDAETRATMVKFAKCMRDAGLDFEDPGPNGFNSSTFDQSDPAFTEAAQACMKKYPVTDLGISQ
ncbi:hypothetical protein ACIPSE_46240 [Streptomyces sp. NPDC090106]|uniref:hypothetical protein n=1 Tax=Streptomyces sp. NPDC090106 TaxID=3365946 RepID=UPI00382CB121